MGAPVDCAAEHLVYRNGVPIDGDFCDLVIRWATHDLLKVEPHARVLRAKVYEPPPKTVHTATVNIVVLELSDGTRRIRQLLTCPGICEGITPPL